MTNRLYRHICGYPLQEDNELKRCPGCGGRITPWNTNLADETMAESYGSAEEALKHIAGWLAEHHPNIAQDLHDAIEGDLRAEDRSNTETRLRQLQGYLADKLPSH
jgi:hypothetical protein